MPKLSPTAVPSYRKHKASGQACVVLSGRTHYLGKHGTAASKARYNELVAEWLAAGRQLPEPGHDLTLNEVMVPFLRYARVRYGDGKELGCLKDALRVLKGLYGSQAAGEFGPRAFKAMREKFLELGWSRPYANRQSQRVRRMIKWAVSEELLPGEVYHALLAVDGLRRGDPGCRETEPVRPVPEAFVESVKPLVSPQVRAMIELQALTGMRPGEVCIMRTVDLETSGAVWVYRPEHHKTEHHGHTREVYLGPRAQEVLKPWLRANVSEYLFQPVESVAWQSAERRKSRKTPLWTSHVDAKARQKKRRRRCQHQPHYSTKAYALAINRACKKAGVPTWGPNRLRHSAATNLRKEYGIELARIVLGHTTAFTTEIYAEADKAQAMEAIGRVG